MTTPANPEVTLTGTLSNLTARSDWGINATLTHPEAQLWVIFPAEVVNPNLLDEGARVTVHGVHSGEAIRAVKVEAAS